MVLQYLLTVWHILSEPEEDTYQDSDEEFDEEDSKQAALTKVDVDIYLSAFANARRYYNVMKQSAAKQEKTLLAADRVRKRLLFFFLSCYVKCHLFANFFVSF